MTHEIENKLACVLYFTAPTCNVCKALKPKLFEALNQNFEKLEIREIDISKEQETAARYNVFSIPTLIVFFEGKEFVRKSRYMSVDEVVAEIERVYNIVIED